jgi:hypothetical protein
MIKTTRRLQCRFASFLLLAATLQPCLANGPTPFGEVCPLICISNEFKSDKQFNYVLPKLVAHISPGGGEPLFQESSPICCFWIGKINLKDGMGKYVFIYHYYPVLLVDGVDGLSAFLDDVKAEGVPPGRLWKGARMLQNRMDEKIQKQGVQGEAK